MFDIRRDEIFQKNSRLHHFWPHKKWRNFGRVENIRSWQETKKIKIKYPTTFKKNEQQEDYKNSAEMDEDDLEDLLREYKTGQKRVCEGLTRDGKLCWWWW
jgi:hypothetical protein